MDQLKKIPFWMFFFLFALYTGYQVFEFEMTDSGEVAKNNVRVNQEKQEIAGLKAKLVEGEKFTKTLDVKKDDIRSQVKRLAEYQGVLADSLDVPELIKVLITETKRIQLKVDRNEPGRKGPKENYIEQEFKMMVRGTYVQMVLLAQRISQLQRILRIESFNFKPVKNAAGRPTGALDADISIIAYQYAMSNEDSIARPFK